MEYWVTANNRSGWQAVRSKFPNDFAAWKTIKFIPHVTFHKESDISNLRYFLLTAAPMKQLRSRTNIPPRTGLSFINLYTFSYNTHDNTCAAVSFR